MTRRQFSPPKAGGYNATDGNDEKVDIGRLKMTDVESESASTDSGPPSPFLEAVHLTPVKLNELAARLASSPESEPKGLLTSFPKSPIWGKIARVKVKNTFIELHPLDSARMRKSQSEPVLVLADPASASVATTLDLTHNLEMTAACSLPSPHDPNAEYAQLEVLVAWMPQTCSPCYLQYIAPWQCSSITDTDRCRQNGHGKKKPRKVPVGDWKRACKIVEDARSNIETVWEAAKRDTKSSADVQLAIKITALIGFHYGCWNDAWNMVKGFLSHVKKGCECKSANYALQVMLEQLPTELISPIARELGEIVVDAAMLKSGCRVVIRLVRHHAGSDDPVISAAIEKIIGSMKVLAEHEYGTFVVQAVFESERPAHRQAAMEAFKGHLHLDYKILCPSMGSGKEDSRRLVLVLEKAFQFCEADDAQEMVNDLLSNRDGLRELINNESGVHVLKAALAKKVEVDGIETPMVCSVQLAQALIAWSTWYGWSKGKLASKVLMEAEKVVAKWNQSQFSLRPRKMWPTA